MSTDRFVETTALAAPPATVFETLAEPRRLDSLTPGWIRFGVVERPEKIAVGSRIAYRLRWHGVPLAWTSEIEVWEPPHRLRYRQTRGPWRTFVHEQTFREIEGGTLLTSTIDFRAPLGALGRWAGRRDLARLFASRKARLRILFPGSGELEKKISSPAALGHTEAAPDRSRPAEPVPGHDERISRPPHLLGARPSEASP